MTDTTTERRNILARGVLAYQDILDQPRGKYFLVLSSDGMANHLFSVNEVVIEEHYIVAFDHEGNRVVAFSPSIPWYAVNRDYAEEITTEEMASRSAEDRKLMEDLEKKLYPEDRKETAKMALSLPPGGSGRDVGQYL